MSNKYIRSSIGVISIVDKMRENRLKWFGHILRREKTETVRLVKKKVWKKTEED